MNNQSTADHWIGELLDEYGGNASDNRIGRLLSIFGDRDPEIMKTAVFAYMAGGGRFFPRVGELMPYVEAAADRYGHDQGPGPGHLKTAIIRRQAAIEAAYGGNVDRADFDALIGFYRRWHMDYSAAYLERKLAEFWK